MTPSSRYPLPATGPVQLTEKLLIGAGGWEVIRHARGLREAGRVTGASYSPPLLQGMVREGDREYKAGLKIRTATDIENLCTCRPSRAYGTICAHSVAVGLAILAGMNPPAPAAALMVQGRTPPPANARPAVTLPFQADPNAAARLHVILAPNLESGWEKGQIMVGLELSAGGSRQMLGAPGTPRALLADDLRVIERLASAMSAVPGGMNFIDCAAFLNVVEALAGHPRVTLGKSGAIRVESAPLLPPLRATFTGDGALDLAVQWPAGSRPLVAGGRAFLFQRGAARTSLQPLSPGLPAAYQALFEEKSRRLPPDHAVTFLATEWPKLAPFFDLKADPLPAQANAAGPAATPALAGVEPGTPRFELEIEGSLNQLGAVLTARYPNDRAVTIGVTPERDTFIYTLPGGARGVRHTRNFPAEVAALAEILPLGFTGPDPTGHYFLRGEPAILRFFAHGLPALQARAGWKITVGSRFTQVSRNIEVITPEIGLRGSGEDWFEMELSLRNRAGERIPAAEIQRLLQMGGGSARLSNGKLAVLPADALDDLQQVLRDCDPAQLRPGVFRLGKSQGGFIDDTLEKWGVAVDPAWQSWRGRREEFRRAAEPKLTPALATALRPYQNDGIRWLALLAANGLGGILADEMGLGKTLQALAYLSAQRGSSELGTRNSELAESSGSAAPRSEFHAPSLVVCPTSLVDNWRAEAAKFTPELRTLTIDGPDRAGRFAQIPAHDLVVTSYALLRRDLDRYRATEFAHVILDEAHHIKNPDSQVAQAACALRARQRFVLTGTPMENSVRDLWSILRFAVPGYLGSRQDFRERYELPLGRPGDPAADAVRERLTRRLRPVMLRRRKADVATELPARIEQTAFCDLTPAQAEVYRGLLEQSRLKLDNARREKNKGAGRMLVLTALLRLRQACCDLRLLGEVGSAKSEVGSDGLEGTLADNDSDSSPLRLPTSYFSAKLALLDELLTEIHEGSHRVLIFSQFVSMLKILAAHLEGRGTPFCYLDGSTKPRDRTAAVARFQADESITAFLISVKAGGVGLNLTGADTVIHFDPWWNPAVEAQATDRAHRIGQTKVVTAYRLIARGTVEEKIFALQNRKKELTASLVEREKDEPLLETLSFEEIEGLLE